MSAIDVHANATAFRKRHHCTLPNKSEIGWGRPPSDFFGRILFYYRKSILITDKHPMSNEFFRSNVEIKRLRKIQVDSKSLIIHPFSHFRAYYEIFAIFMYLITMFYLPAEAAFDLYDHPDADITQPHNFRILNLGMKILCFIEIFMEFVTGYAIKRTRTIVMKPKKIAFHYVFGLYFLPDFLAAIPEPFFINNHMIQLLINTFGLCKITRLPTLFAYARRATDYLKIRSLVFDILKNTVVFYMIFHWFACAQLVIPHLLYIFYREISVYSWTHKYDLDLNNFLSVYLLCVYRSFGQLLCVNYEKVYKSVTNEAIWQIIASIFGKVFTTYVSVMVLQAFLSMRSLEMHYFETMSQVQSFMRKRKLPLAMQNRIVQFYSFKYRNKFFKESKMTSLLNDKLCAEISMSVCSRLLQSITFLKELPRKNLEMLVRHLKNEIYLPRDMIIKAGTSGECMYFLASGTVAVWTPTGQEMCHLQDGAYFGEISLIFKDKKRTANIVAIEICEVYKLDRKVFKNCFKAHQKLYNMIEDLAKERLEMTQLYQDIHEQAALNEL